MAKRGIWLTLSSAIVLSFLLSFGATAARTLSGVPQAASQVVTSVPEKKFFPGVYSAAEQKMLGRAGRGRSGGTPIHFMAFARNEMVRAVTNYIGDDGWLRKFNWWKGGCASDLLSKAPAFQGQAIAFGHGKVSDVIICMSYVAKKYVADDGSHRLDLIVWSEDIEGIPEQVAEVNIGTPCHSAKLAALARWATLPRLSDHGNRNDR